MIMMNQGCLRRIVTGNALPWVSHFVSCNVSSLWCSGNDDDHDREKMDEKGKAVLDKIRLNTRDDYVKVNITIYQNAF